MNEKEIKKEQNKSIRKFLYLLLSFAVIYSRRFVSDKINELELFHGLSTKAGTFLEASYYIGLLLIIAYILKPQTLWPEFSGKEKLSAKERDWRRSNTLKRILFIFIAVEPFTYWAFEDLLYKLFNNDILSIIAYFSFKIIIGILILKPKKLWPEFFDRDRLRNMDTEYN